jgi:PAS domain S-box-containing protein
LVANRRFKKTLAAGEILQQSRKASITTKQLKNDEIFFKTVLDNTGLAIILLDLNGNILYTNPAFQNLLHYSNNELIALSLKDIIHPDDFDTAEKLFNEIAANNDTKYTTEKRYLTKDGNIICGLTTISATYDLKNKRNSILAIVEKISGEKQFENKLISEKIFLDALLKNSPDVIYFKDIESRFLKVSNALSKKHNIPVGDLLGKTDFDVFGVNHANDAFKDEQEIIKTGIPIVGKEETEDWPDGTIGWASTSKMPFYDREGKLIGTFGISRDITIKKKAEHIREALFKISETAFTSPDMPSLFKKIHEIVGTLMSAKNLFIAMYNEKDDLISFPYYVDQYNKPRETSKLKNGITEYIMRAGEAVLITIDKLRELNEQGELEIMSTPPKIFLGVPLKVQGIVTGVLAVKDYDNPSCYGESEMQLFTFIAEQIAQAIERKRSSDEIKIYSEELKQLNATKDRFFSIIAHDLKNPFITILGFTDLLSSEYNELTDEERLTYINEMKDSAKLSFNLLQNLLHWSSSQTGRIEFVPQKLDLFKLINENLLLLNNSAEQKQIHLLNKVPAGINVIADEDMLNTVVRNLLTNAIKFSNKCGMIEVIASLKENYAEICVSDCGVGMDQKIINNLFRLDVAHSTAGTENETGTGLGLILCKEFIERNGGTIRVESQPGIGSKFIFTLPV